MISKVFSQSTLPKSDKKKFIPFVNERNFMGSLLSDTNKSERVLQEKNEMRIIENINKTTKEYLFEKKYNKMLKKWQSIEDSFQKKETDYDEEVRICLESILKMTLNSTSSDKKEEQPYLYKCTEMAMKAKKAKEQIKLRLKERNQNKQEKKRCRTLKLQEEFEKKEERRVTKQSMIKTEYCSKKSYSKVNRQVFHELGNNSQYMADFTNQGMKYRYLINGKKINPWRSWYKKDEIEVYPGETIICKKLQKSIY